MHPETVMSAHEVGAADSDPGPVGRREAAHFDPVLGTAPHHVDRNHAIVDNPGLPVHVFEEKVQGLDTLGQTCLELPPIGVRHYPGQTVDGNYPLVRLVVPVACKSYALVGERAVDPLPDAAELFRGELVQGLVKRPAMFSRSSVRPEHLVVDRRVEIVVIEIHATIRTGQQFRPDESTSHQPAAMLREHPAFDRRSLQGRPRKGESLGIS